MNKNFDFSKKMSLKFQKLKPIFGSIDIAGYNAKKAIL